MDDYGRNYKTLLKRIQFAVFQLITTGYFLAYYIEYFYKIPLFMDSVATHSEYPSLP
jgi:hypothetical protein